MGTIIIIAILCIAPVAILIGMSVVATISAWALNADNESRTEGTEFYKLAFPDESAMRLT